MTVVCARSPEELLERLRIVLDRLRDVGLKAKPSKCELFRTEIKFLGHLVSADGINPMPDKLEAIRDWPVPHCLKDVRSFYGLASYYSRFVKGLPTIAETLTRLTRKMARFEWSEEAQQEFEAIKKAVVEATSLAFPVPQEPCILDTDASDVGRWNRATDCIFLSGHERDPEELLHDSTRVASSHLRTSAFPALFAGKQNCVANRPSQSEMVADI